MTFPGVFSPLPRAQKDSVGLLRIGVLGASRIVKQALCDVSDGLVSVDAVAARDLSRAEIFAHERGIPRAYGSYLELLNDPAIDAVYIALPCAYHAQWCILALQQGKHVLCEKPFALDVEEANQVLETARDNRRLVMEGHHWRYHPLVAPMQSRATGLGDLYSLEAQFKVGLNAPGDIRLNPVLGAGVVMDFGCYTVQWMSWLARVSRLGGGEEGRPGVNFGVANVVAADLRCEDSGVDLAAEVDVEWGSVSGHLSCDMSDNLPFRAYLRAEFERGVLHFENPLGVEGSYLESREGQRREKLIGQGPSTYRRQLEAFVYALRTGTSPPTSGETIVETQRTLDEIYKKSSVISRRDLRARALAQRKGTRA